MTIYEALASVRTDMQKVNSKLDESGLDAVTIETSRVSFGSKDNTLVVYPTSNGGSTYQDDGGNGMMRIAIEYYMSDEFTAEALDTLEMYFSVILDFIHGTTFCLGSDIADATIFRMDEGETANGFAILLNVKIAIASDFGW